MMNSDWRDLMSKNLTSNIQVSLSYAVKHNYVVGFQSIMGMKNCAIRA